MVDLSTNQKRALAALLTEPNIRRAALRCGLGENTLFRYLRNPVFQAALRARQDEILASVVAGLSGLSQDAVDKLAASLALLADHLDADLSDFITLDGDGWRLDLEKAKDKLALIKKLVRTKDGDRLELVDSQSAAYSLGRLALGILDARRKAAELDDLIKRVEAIEERLEVK